MAQPEEEKYKTQIRLITNNYPHQCNICGQGFLRYESLTCHMRIHTKERPFVCSICSKSYTRKDKLTRHAIVHTGERPFVCQSCGKSFTRKDKMTRHELIHKVEKPFTCVPCNLEFPGQDAFSNHMARKHPDRLRYTIIHERGTPYPEYMPRLGQPGIVAPTTSTQTDPSMNNTHSTLIPGPSQEELAIGQGHPLRLLKDGQSYLNLTTKLTHP